MGKKKIGGKKQKKYDGKGRKSGKRGKKKKLRKRKKKFYRSAVLKIGNKTMSIYLKKFSSKILVLA